MNRMMIWTCAVALTVALSVWQRRSGPTYAVRGEVTIEGQNVRYHLERSFAGEGDAPVRIPARAVTGVLNFRPAAPRFIASIQPRLFLAPPCANCFARRASPALLSCR